MGTTMYEHEKKSGYSLIEKYQDIDGTLVEIELGRSHFLLREEGFVARGEKKDSINMGEHPTSIRITGGDNTLELRFFNTCDSEPPYTPLHREEKLIKMIKKCKSQRLSVDEVYEIFFDRL